MLQEDNAVRVLSYRELIHTLQGLCTEKQSGVMVISSESGSTARFTLEQGAIYDVSFAGLSGKPAVLQIKKITQGKTAFFKRAQGNSARLIDLSTEDILKLLTEIPSVPQEKLDSIIPHVEQFSVIEAQLATIIGPVAEIVYREYQLEIRQADTLAKLSESIEKIAQQNLLPEKQKLFKQNIRDFIVQCGAKNQVLIIDTLKSGLLKELKLQPSTLAFFIKCALHGEMNTILFTKLANYLELAGNLIEQLSLFDVLRFLEKTTKTGLLSIESAGRKAGFYFNQGILINAVDGERHGVAVALELMQSDADNMYFVSMQQVTINREITQSAEVLINSVQASLANKEGLKQHGVRTDKKTLSADEIQAALTKQIQHLQHKEDKKISETEFQSSLAKAIQRAESYDNSNAEQLLVQLLSSNDRVYEAWFWLAHVLNNMTAIEFSLKKAAYLNAKSAELVEEVKKFTFARKTPKGDFVLRCPFCWMPVRTRDNDCPHCAGSFFIDSQFFNKVGKAKTDIMDKAIARYDQVLHQHAINSADIYTLFYLAMAYLNRQYYHEALAQLNEIVKLAPDNLALSRQNALLHKQMLSVGLISTTTQTVTPSSTSIAKILVVEDSVVTRKVIVRTLTSAGYQVFEAKDAEEALTDIVARHPDLILLDIILPGSKDGYEILADIKKIPELLKVPVIMLTSRDSLFDKLKGKVSDANEYLTKPFQPDELLSVVKKYLK